MGLKFRRGSTAQQSGSLAFGEPYVNTTLGTLVVGGASGDIVLSAGGTGSTGNFGAISGSGLDITGNANIAGNLTLGGTITIGDAPTDNVVVNADLSSSIIPNDDNAFDLGSSSKRYRAIYGTNIYGAINATNGVISGSSQLNTLATTGSNTFKGNQTIIGSGAGFAAYISTSVNDATLGLDTTANVNAMYFLKNGEKNFEVSFDTTNANGIFRLLPYDNNSFIQIGNPSNSGNNNSDYVFVSEATYGNVLLGPGIGNATSYLGGSTPLTDKVQIAGNLYVSGAISANSFTGSIAATNGVVSGSSQVIGILTSLNTYTGSNDTTNGTQNTRLTALETSASNALATNNGQGISITNLNTFSGSQLTQNSTLATYTGSVETRFGTLATLTGSNAIRLTNLETTSASVNTSITNLNTATSSYETKGRGVVSGSSQITYASISSIPSGIISGSSQLSGTTITNLTITNLTTVNQTASVLFSSGSNKFGDFGDDTHEFTGSVKISGSITTIGTATATSFNGTINATNGVVSGSSQIVYASISSIPAGIVSGSSQLTSILPAGVVSGSSQITATSTTGFATGVKTQLDANTVVSGSTQVIGILSSLNTYTGSNNTTNTTQDTRLTALEASASTALSTNNTQGTSITNLNSATASLMIETANLETFSSSALTRLDNLEGKDISITLTGDVTGTGTITNLANVSFATTIAADSVALGTDTTGNYVASLVAGTNITLSNNSGEGATPTIGLTNNSTTIGSTAISLGSSATTIAGLTSVTSTGFTGALTGNASTATTLATARTINGTSFDGGSNITIPNLVSGSAQITAGSTTNFATDVKTQLNSNTVVSGSSQITYASISSIPSGIISGSSQLSGTTITNLTITNLTTVNQTASVLFSSGSNKFGDFGDDTHEFTGSVKISGSITTIGTATATSFNGTINATNGVVSGSSQIVYASISSIPAGIVSGSSQLTSILPAGVVSGSSQITATSTTGFATGVKTQLDANTVVSGSTQVIGILSSLNTYTGSNNTTNTTQDTRLTALEASASTALSTNNTQGTSITNLNSATASLMIETANLETFSSSALTRLDNLEGKDISITLTGDVTGTGTITNLANVSFATTIAADSVALGTDTTGNYVASLVAGTNITLSNNSGEGATPTIGLTNNSTTIGSTAISLGSSATTIAGLTSVTSTGFTGALTGNASTATTLATARNINGVSFNGSADITVTAAAGTLSGATLSSGVTASSLTSVGTLTSLTVTGAITANGGVAVTGALTATGDITAYYSDGRLKENLQVIPNALEKVSKLTGYTYNTNALGKQLLNNKNDNDIKVGVIAQDLQEVLPQAVKFAPFDRDAEGNSKSGENYLTVQYEKIVPLLIQAIKEQQTQIHSLTLEIEKLKEPKGL